jgi:hypothetical protein
MTHEINPEIETGTEFPTDPAAPRAVDVDPDFFGYADDREHATTWAVERVDDTTVHVEVHRHEAGLDEVDGPVEEFDVDPEKPTRQIAREIAEADPEEAVQLAREFWSSDLANLAEYLSDDPGTLDALQQARSADDSGDYQKDHVAQKGPRVYCLDAHGSLDDAIQRYARARGIDALAADTDRREQLKREVHQRAQDAGLDPSTMDPLVLPAEVLDEADEEGR